MTAIISRGAPEPERDERRDFDHEKTVMSDSRMNSVYAYRPIRSKMLKATAAIATTVATRRPRGSDGR